MLSFINVIASYFRYCISATKLLCGVYKLLVLTTIGCLLFFIFQFTFSHGLVLGGKIPVSHLTQQVVPIETVFI